MNRKKSFPIINMGTSLLLVVFIVICLIVFATLSLSSSMRDQKYSDSAVLKNENYYKAYSKAQRQLKEIDQAIINHEDLTSLEDIEISSNDNHTYLSFKETIDKNQDLSVEIQLTNDQNRYKIIKWQEITSKEWKNDQTLPLLGNE